MVHPWSDFAWIPPSVNVASMLSSIAEELYLLWSGVAKCRLVVLLQIAFCFEIWVAKCTVQELGAAVLVCAGPLGLRTRVPKCSALPRQVYLWQLLPAQWLCVKLWEGWTISQSVNQETNHPINQPILYSFNQPKQIEEPINLRWTHASVHPSIHPPIRHFISQTIDLSSAPNQFKSLMWSSSPPINVIWSTNNRNLCQLMLLPVHPCMFLFVHCSVCYFWNRIFPRVQLTHSFWNRSFFLICFFFGIFVHLVVFNGLRYLEMLGIAQHRHKEPSAEC